ncbi:MAG TPA: c-type cytochrome, partial [Caulobacteraceae bacterium]
LGDSDMKAAAVVALIVLAACQRSPMGQAAARGKIVIVRAQCGACHEIPGVFAANGLVGPPLAGFGRRTMIAGMLPNTRDNLVLWLRYPQKITPGNAMPDTGLSEAEARDVAAYLDGLR